jgi:hypothetical protein
MGEAKRRQKFDPGAGMAFNGKRDDAAGRQHTGDGGEDRREIVDIDKDIGRKHEIVVRRCGGFGGEKFRQVANLDAVVKSFVLGARDHRR